MIPELDVPIVLVHIAFALVGGGISYYSWVVIRHHRRRMARKDRSRWERLYDTFVAVVMIVPLVGFALEFAFFSYKAITETVSTMLP